MHALQAQRLSLKVHAVPIAGAAVAAREAVPVFHRWIQGHVLDDTLIDVTDYTHVHHGPGVLLVCHGANYALDETDGRLGFAAQRKRDLPGSFEERLAALFYATLAAALRLEEDPVFAGRLRFRGDDLRFRIHDRLLAPDTATTFAAVEPALRALYTQLLGGIPVELDHRPGERTLFTVALRAASPADLSLLIARL